jgi:hypothetical protein
MPAKQSHAETQPAESREASAEKHSIMTFLVRSNHYCGLISASSIEPHSELQREAESELAGTAIP